MWGETWPAIIVEIIDWEKGMGGQYLVSAKTIELEGQNPVCPDPAESWCGTMGNLYWDEDFFVHHFEALDNRYICKTLVGDREIDSTTCEIERWTQPVGQLNTAAK